MSRSTLSWLLSKSASPVLNRIAYLTAAPDTPNPKQIVDQAQRLCSALKGQRPTKNPRQLVLLQFQLRLLASQQPRDATTKGRPRLSYVPPPYPPCVAPLSELKKTMIDDLLLETQHRGTYMLVRSLTPHMRTTGVKAIVEDEKGDVLVVQLHHQADDGEPVVREGTVMILKEPFLNVKLDGGHELRVDHLSDVVFLAANDERIPAAWRKKPDHSGTALAWKLEGDKHLNRSEYRSAIKCYTQSIACQSATPEEICTARLSRSLALLKVEEYDAALSDAEFVATTAAAASKLTEKARLRKAEALYGLQRYRECRETLTEPLRLDPPDNAAARARLSDATVRLNEQTHGKYPFKRIHDEAAKLRPPRLDRATYIGPVRVQDAGSRGRGLFTTKAVKAGDLLFCEKAFAYACFDEDADTREFPVVVDHEAGVTQGAPAELVSIAIQKLYRNPSLIPTITTLHHGSYQPVATTHVDGQSIIDSFLLRRITSINAFRGALSTLAAADNPQSNPDCSGIWAFASYLNHSCLATATCAFIGDLLIARASRDLPSNTELTFAYKAPKADSKAESADGRPRFQTWGFECDCPLCADAKGLREGVVEERRALAEGVRRAAADVMSAAASPDAVVRRVEMGLEALEKTYTRPAEEVPRLEVWDAFFNVVDALEAGKMTMTAEQAVRLALKAFRALGYVIEGGERGTLVVRKWGPMVGGEVRCWILLRAAYLETAPELMAPAEEYARTAYRIMVGEDETFERLLEGHPRLPSPRPPTPKSLPPRPAGTSRWARTPSPRSPTST